ncbi:MULTISPECIES: hypothetical protein [unclassified Crossiella]|uniref:hypothetical protein n=1 Tax=unclassified Crossiella TaxID=2620835 RepID=UPI001FFED337|nr:MULTISPECIES: hypothetical protein [unclassified Crossiella]MCK2240104.1 hypothetical protein [Crossiella sp. S99.2]MCK2253444.1 hypothetical protein [Crossiella sp. S99.1]
MPVTIAAARTAAARWVAEHATGDPGFGGAYLAGSAAWLPADAVLPATSDVDIMLVTGSSPAPPKPGKCRQDGLLLEPTYLSWTELSSPKAVLSDYHLAGGLRVNTILADPTGRLTALQAAVARDFSAPRWIRRRCAHAETRIRTGLMAAQTPQPWPWQVTRWLFATGVTTHVLLVAAQRNPTIRRRYAATRALLTDLGHPDWQEELLTVLGCAHLTPDQVRGHLDALTTIFDEAGPAAATSPVSFAGDLSAQARPVAIDGAHELLAAGEHREAMFWLAATYARCLIALNRDNDPAFTELMADLGHPTGPADLHRQIGRTEAFLPRLTEMREVVLASS